MPYPVCSLTSRKSLRTNMSMTLWSPQSLKGYICSRNYRTSHSQLCGMLSVFTVLNKTTSESKWRFQSCLKSSCPGKGWQSLQSQWSQQFHHGYSWSAQLGPPWTSPQWRWPPKTVVPCTPLRGWAGLRCIAGWWPVDWSRTSHWQLPHWCQAFGEMS